MFIQTLKQVKTAISLLVVFTLLTGFVYPIFVTAIAQLLFPWQANGSLVMQSGIAIGSHLIGQEFTAPQYFWGRPSATALFPYNAANSSGSNLGPMNPDLLTAVKKRVDVLHTFDPNKHMHIPVELVTASGSGLDPEISVSSAMYQVPRVAKLRHMDSQQLGSLVKKLSINRLWGILGVPRINVLQLNLALDQLSLGKEIQ